MSGGKGGGQTTKTEIPVWAENATKRNLARAEEVQKIGYMPYYGIDVAGFNPTQQAAMENNLAAASAFGMGAPADAMAGMPQAQPIGGGMSGYSSGDLFDQAVAEFERREPAYAKEYNELFAGGNTDMSNAYPYYPGSDRLGSIPVDYNPYAGQRSMPPLPDTRGGEIPMPVPTIPPGMSVDPSPLLAAAAPQTVMPQLQQLNVPSAPGNQLSLPAAPKKGIDQMMFDMRNVGRIS